MSHFTAKYAELYDTFYSSKNYSAEVSFIQRMLDQYLPEGRVILDYGCGTGNHSIILAGKNYRVIGVDVNEEMLRIAKRKTAGRNNPSFLSIGERESIESQSIDVCICLFDVLSYMNSNNEILDFLHFVHRVLVTKGLLIFDFWYGPGVFHLGPQRRWKEYRGDGKKILRLTNPRQLFEHNIVSVEHKVLIFHGNSVDEVDETHNMRYFFLPEVELFLNSKGFDMLLSTSWMQPDLPPTENDWSALVVARKNG
jgi:SAM-dependent methyltransferase